MELVILTPEKELFKGEIKSVKVPGANGQFEILSNHAPIVSSLDKGTVRVVDSQSNAHEFTIANGFVEVLNNAVSVLVVETPVEQPAS